eukprot:3001989-Amphidinium_carterae.2
MHWQAHHLGRTPCNFVQSLNDHANSIGVVSSHNVPSKSRHCCTASPLSPVLPQAAPSKQLAEARTLTLE